MIIRPDKELLDQVKGVVKRIPGIQSLNGIRHKIMQIRELSGLIKENRIVIVHPYSRDETLFRVMLHELLKEWIDLFGIVRLRRTTAAAIDAPAEAVLLFIPQALLRIPASHEEYLRQVRHETRRAIRVAERQGYKIEEFSWNDHLDEIYAINTSKEMRQSEPMRGWYREPVQPRYHSKEELQYRDYGAFKDGKLWGYLHLLITGDFASPIHIIGHAQHLQYGIMNGLLSYSVRECIKNSEIRWLYYERYREGSSLDTFKKHAGFQKYAMLIDLEDDQELLKHSEHTVKTLWRI